MRLEKIRQTVSIYGDICYLAFFLPIAGCVALGIFSGNKVYKALFAVALVSILLKLGSTEYSKGEKVGLLAVAVLIAGVFMINRERSLILSFLAVAGVKRVDVKRVLKFTLYIYSAAFFTAVILSVIGLREGTVHLLPKGGQWYEISDFGFSHPNSAYNHLLMIALLIILAYGESLRWYHYVVITMVMYGGYKILLCRSGWLLYINLCILLLLRAKMKGRRLYDNILCLFPSVPWIMAVLSLLLPFLYGQGWNGAWKLNEMITGRLSIFWEALNNSGISLYATDVVRYKPDNAYLYILLNYGAVLLVLYLTIYTVAMNCLRKKGEDLALIVMSITAIYCFMEYSLINATWNPCMLYLSYIFV